MRGEEGELGWDGGTLVAAGARASACCASQTGPPDDALAAAAESVAAQIAMSRALQESAARRRAMLDVAFDSVVTMDADGVVLSVNRAAERLFGYGAARDGRAHGRGDDHPAVAARGAPARARALPADRARAGRGAAGGADRDARRRDRVPGRARRHAARSVRRPAVFYGYLRDLTARYVAEASLHRLADEQAALRRVATAVAAEHDSARLFALVSEEVGRLLEARTAHMFRFDPDGIGRGDHRRLGAVSPSTCSRRARGCRSTATRR